METGEGPKVEKSPEKSKWALRIAATDKFAEIGASIITMCLEGLRQETAHREEIGILSPRQVGSIPTGAVENWTFTHIGDVWEVASLFTATRLAMVGVNEAFKRVTKKEIPDEACFWASMATSVALPTLMELNITPLPWLGEKLNRVSDPADLFGVGVGALVITASHYASKYREPIKRVASLTATRIAEGGKFVAGKFKEFDEK